MPELSPELLKRMLQEDAEILSRCQRVFKLMLDYVGSGNMLISRDVVQNFYEEIEDAVDKIRYAGVTDSARS